MFFFTESSNNLKTPDVNSINGVDAKRDSPSKVGSHEKEAANLPQPQAATQQETLKKMAQDVDFVGFTPLLRACFTYKTFQVGVCGSWLPKTIINNV